MSKINWIDCVKVGDGKNHLYLQNELSNKSIENQLIAKDLCSIRARFKKIIWPLYKYLSDFIFDGFVEKYALTQIDSFLSEQCIFLEIACGDMSIGKNLPSHIWYNAFDYRLKKIYVDGIFSSHELTNLAVATVSNIPVADDALDFIVCMQAFMHFPDTRKAFDEIKRISKSGAVVVVSISNDYSRVYQVRGPHPDLTCSWGFEEFISEFTKRGFDLLNSKKMGYWIRTPQWLTQRALTVPIEMSDVNKNSVFLFTFKKR